MVTRSKDGIFKPKVYTNQAPRRLVEVEPQTVDDALMSNSWKKAMEEEYDALMKNKTWTLVPPMAGMKIVGNKWVFRLKYDSEGKVQRYKARLVVQKGSSKHLE